MGIEVSGGRFTVMGNAMTTSVVRRIESLLVGGSVTGLSDRQLIERFAAGRDPLAAEAAFAALVARHGPMVLGLCRQLLGDHQHAEDAFQAVFLVLARRARSLRDPDLLGQWLYGVALRTARKARGRIARIRPTEEAGARDRPEACGTMPADRSAIDREQAEALHAEIDRLPTASRLPVVLCYFEGLALAEAAERLRCPAGTVHSRLVRAREKLRRGLLRRGVVLSATAMAAALAPRSASASVPPLLCDSTTRAAIAFAARHTAAGGAMSAPAAALAQEVLRIMLIHKLRLVATSALALAVLATGVGAWARSQAMQEEPATEPAKPVARAAPAAADRPRAETRPGPADPGRMTVAGRVLDPDRQPVKNAVVEVVALRRTPEIATAAETDDLLLLGRARSDGDGRFRCDVPRVTPRRARGLMAMAAVPGYGVRAAYLDADQPEAEIKLQPEQVVRARLVDITGAPARGVEVRVAAFWRPGDPDSEDGAGIGIEPPDGFRTWPRPARTDDQGRFSLSGIGAGLLTKLKVRDSRYASQDLHIKPNEGTPSGEIILALEPARIIEGRALAADTGRPIPGAIVSAMTQVHNEFNNGLFTTKFRADEQGRFRINPMAGESYTLYAFPTGGEPYLISQDELKWTKGAVRMAHDIKAPRGVAIRGKVTGRGTGQPLPESSIQFIPTRDDNTVVSGWQAIVASRDDGSFQVVAPPGKGHLLVFGPTEDYIAEEIGSNRLHGQGPGGLRHRAHAIIPYEARAGGPPPEIAVTLRPGVTVKGRVEGPDGRPINLGMLITTLPTDVTEATDGTWENPNVAPIRNGRFELRGLDPAGSTRVWIVDYPGYERGATVEISGKQAGQETVIRLQPCGRAKARFVGPDGKPVARYRTTVEFVATPGPSRYSMKMQDHMELLADSTYVAAIDPKHYLDNNMLGPVTDAEGRITLVSLIPGALYRISDESTINDEGKGQQIRKDFTVKPGETLDLGDVLVEKP